MLDDIIARQLHDKATRGISLTATEQAELNAWYAWLGQEEAASLASSPKATSPWDALRDEMKNASERLQTASEQFQAQAEKYEDLRRDAAVLSEQVPKPKLPKPKPPKT